MSLLAFLCFQGVFVCCQIFRCCEFLVELISEDPNPKFQLGRGGTRHMTWTFCKKRFKRGVRWGRYVFGDFACAPWLGL